MRIYWIVTLSVLISLFITACSMVTVDPPRSVAEVADPTSTSFSPGSTPTESSLTPVDRAADADIPIVAQAREHLVRKLGIPAAQISLFSVESITWPDASLGCPQSGSVYAQIETPGYLILLEAGGKAYTYHTDTTESIVLCEVRPPSEIYNPP